MISHDKYCAECGYITRHKIIRGYYAASTDYSQCLKCGRTEQIPKQEWFDI